MFSSVSMYVRVFTITIQCSKYIYTPQILNIVHMLMMAIER